VTAVPAANPLPEIVTDLPGTTEAAGASRDPAEAGRVAGIGTPVPDVAGGVLAPLVGFSVFLDVAGGVLVLLVGFPAVVVRGAGVVVPTVVGVVAESQSFDTISSASCTSCA
jgi:hypothetical protein